MSSEKVVMDWNKTYPIHICIKKNNNSSKTENNKHLKKWGQESYHSKLKITFSIFLQYFATQIARKYLFHS